MISRESDCENIVNGVPIAALSFGKEISYDTPSTTAYATPNDALVKENESPLCKSNSFQVYFFIEYDHLSYREFHAYKYVLDLTHDVNIECNQFKIKAHLIRLAYSWFGDSSESRNLLIYVENRSWTGVNEDYSCCEMVAMRVFRVLYDYINLVTIDVLPKVIYVPDSELIYPSLCKDFSV